MTDAIYQLHTIDQFAQRPGVRVRQSAANDSSEKIWPPRTLTDDSQLFRRPCVTDWQSAPYR
jgi:hypothetical protein